jgi:hypothetical protein
MSVAPLEEDAVNSLGAVFTSRKHELPGIAEWMTEQKHKRIYAEDILRLNAEARKAGQPGADGGPHLMPVAL